MSEPKKARELVERIRRSMKVNGVPLLSSECADIIYHLEKLSSDVTLPRSVVEGVIFMLKLDSSGRWKTCIDDLELALKSQEGQG